MWSSNSTAWKLQGAHVCLIKAITYSHHHILKTINHMPSSSPCHAAIRSLSCSGDPHSTSEKKRWWLKLNKISKTTLSTKSMAKYTQRWNYIFTDRESPRLWSLRENIRGGQGGDDRGGQDMYSSTSVHSTTCCP